MCLLYVDDVEVELDLLVYTIHDGLWGSYSEPKGNSS